MLAWSAADVEHRAALALVEREHVFIQGVGRSRPLLEVACRYEERSQPGELALLQSCSRLKSKSGSEKAAMLTLRRPRAADGPCGKARRPRSCLLEAPCGRTAEAVPRVARAGALRRAERADWPRRRRLIRDGPGLMWWSRQRRASELAESRHLRTAPPRRRRPSRLYKAAAAPRCSPPVVSRIHSRNVLER